MVGEMRKTKTTTAATVAVLPSSTKGGISSTVFTTITYCCCGCCYWWYCTLLLHIIIILHTTCCCCTTLAFILPPTPPSVQLFQNGEDGVITTMITTMTTTAVPPKDLMNSTIIGGNSGSSSSNSNNPKMMTSDDNIVYDIIVESVSSSTENETFTIHAKREEPKNNDNDELDFVGAGTLGDIMSGLVSSSSSDGDGLDRIMDEIYDRESHHTTKVIPSIITTTSSSTVVYNNLIDGLVTKEGGELNARYNCNFSPMERIALTANGNLQRIFSSYYDAPVHVHVDSCVRRQSTPPTPQNNTRMWNSTMVQRLLSEEEEDALRLGFHEGDEDYTSSSLLYENDKLVYNNNDIMVATWDRVVHLSVHNHTLCKATSIIRVTSPRCIQLIESGKVGLGQMFRYLNKLPTFSLLDAGRQSSRSGGSDDDDCGARQKECIDAQHDNGGMWRIYKMQCEEMTCLIHEEFHPDAWDVSRLHR